MNVDWAYIRRFRSSPAEVFCKKRFIKTFAQFTGKHQYQGHFFNKVADLRPATLLKKILWHRCFPLNFAKVLKIPLAASDIQKTSRTSSKCLMHVWYTYCVQGYQKKFPLTIPYTHSYLPSLHLYSTHYHSFMGRNRCLCSRSSDFFVLKISFGNLVIFLFIKKKKKKKTLWPLFMDGVQLPQG